MITNEYDFPKGQLDLHLRSRSAFFFRFGFGYFVATMRNPINAAQYQRPHGDKVGILSITRPVYSGMGVSPILAEAG
jgi:hypothetical protein